MSYFHDAVVVVDGATYRFSAEEGRALEGGSHYWHGPGNPSSWLAVAVFQAARERVSGAPQSAALALAAGALGCSIEELRAAIEWHEGYMRFHDGDPTYRVLDEETGGS